MTKWSVLIIMLLGLPIALACKEIYGPSEEVTVQDVMEVLGEDSDCNITLYKNNTLLVTGWMNQHGLAYFYQFGELAQGQYIANIECNKTINATVTSLFQAQCKFEVGEGGDNMYVALALFLALTLGGFVGLGYYINNMRINMERMSAEDQEKGFFKIKTDMIVRAVAVFVAIIMLLTLVGFAYYIGNQLTPLFGKLILVYWIMSLVGIITMFILMVYKMFTFPFQVVGEIFDRQKRYDRR